MSDDLAPLGARWRERRRRHLGYELRLEDRHVLTGEKLTLVAIVPFGLTRQDRAQIVHWLRKQMQSQMRQAQSDA